jgi:hypothetical protein
LFWLTALALAYAVVLAEPIQRAEGVDDSGSLVGRVLEDSGQVDKIQVQAYVILTNDGHGMLVSKCITYTDPGGNYTCTRLPPGRYIVAARPTGNSEPSAGKGVLFDNRYVLTFYPSTSELDDAVPCRLHHGESAEVNIVMNRVPIYKVKGSLPDQPSEVALSLVAVGSSGYRVDVNHKVRYNAATGDFEADSVPQGRYLLQGNWFTDNGDHKSVTGHQGKLMVVVDNQDVEGVHIPEESSARVEVNIKSSDGNVGNLGGVSLDDLTGGSIRFVTPDTSEGRVGFSTVPAGVYRVELGSQSVAYIKSVSVDGIDSDGQRVVIANGRPQITLELEVTATVGTVQGTVKGWEAGGAKSEVLARSNVSGQFYRANTDQQGNFTITGLGPGDYSLYAWHSLRGIEYANPVLLRRYALSRTDVSVTEGSVTQVELELLDEPP